MSTDLELFRFPETGTVIRTLVRDGEPWFFAADVSAALDLGNPYSSLALLDDDERDLHSMETPGGVQKLVIVTEAGLYSLILRSRKTEAKVFKRWLTHDVLPAIRKTGSYSVGREMTELERAKRHVELLEETEAQRRLIAEQDAALAEAAPKVAGYDRLIAADGCRLVGQVAKELGWQAKALRAFLIEERLIFVRQAICGDTQYEPYAAYSAHFRPVEHVVTHRFGDCAHFTLTVEQRGIDLIRKRIADRQAAVRRELTPAT